MHTDADDTHRSCCSSRGMHSGTTTTADDVANVVTSMLPLFGLPSSLAHTLWLRLRRVALICECFGHDAKAWSGTIFSWATLGKAGNCGTMGVAGSGCEGSFAHIRGERPCGFATALAGVHAGEDKVETIRRGALERDDRFLRVGR